MVTDIFCETRSDQSMKSTFYKLSPRSHSHICKGETDAADVYYTQATHTHPDLQYTIDVQRG